MASLYRKSSLEKLSNPEQLDKAIVISSPMSWLALVGILLVIVVTIIWSIAGTLPSTVTVNGILISPADSGAVYSEVAGTVTEVLKTSGAELKAGDVIIKVKNSSGEIFDIKIIQDGTLTDTLVQVDSKVYAGAEVARYTPDIQQEQLVICYVPVTMVNQLEQGMKVLLYPYGIDSQEYGHMEAEISMVGEYAVSASNMWYVTGADNMVADQFLANGPVVAVMCEIKGDSATKSQYYWSSDNAKNIVLSNGTFVSAKIVTEENAPITKLIRNLKEKIEE